LFSTTARKRDRQLCNQSSKRTDSLASHGWLTAEEHGQLAELPQLVQFPSPHSMSGQPVQNVHRARAATLRGEAQGGSGQQDDGLLATSPILDEHIDWRGVGRGWRARLSSRRHD